MIKKMFLAGVIATCALLLSGCTRNDKPETVLKTADDFDLKSPEERTPPEEPKVDQLTIPTPGGNATQKNDTDSAQNKNQSKQPPAMQIDQNKKYSAVLKTTKGEIEITLDAKKTPITVNNFVSLSKENFFSGTIFHRVIKDFMIQGGDPKGDGTGGPGYKFPDEPIQGEYTRGTVAMANSGPDTNGSQFFIIHKDYDLPKKYVIFGNVARGMDVVDKIAEAEVTTSRSGENSKPLEPVKIDSVEIREN